jgi:hypothetical protein
VPRAELDHRAPHTRPSGYGRSVTPVEDEWEALGGDPRDREIGLIVLEAAVLARRVFGASEELLAAEAADRVPD